MRSRDAASDVPPLVRCRADAAPDCAGTPPLSALRARKICEPQPADSGAATRPPNRGLGRGACVSGVKPGPNRAAALGTWELRTDFRRRPPVTGRPDRGMYGPEAGRLGRFACPDAGRGPSKLPRHYLPSPRGKIVAHWNIFSENELCYMWIECVPCSKRQK